MTATAPLAAPAGTALEALGDEIAVLAAHIHAATYRLLVLIAEFDRREGWGAGGGFLSCAHWLSWRTGIALGAAREKVRVARALEKLPRISAAMRMGALSYSKVRALTRVATAGTEAELLEFAAHGTTAHVERLVRAWRRVDRTEAAERAERARHEARALTLYEDEDGSWVVRGRLDPEVGAALRKALEAAVEALRAPEPAEPPTQAQRLADALGLVAERALAARGRTRRAERFQVVVHVGADAGPATAHGGAPGDLRVSAETSRRLACDATRVRMEHDAAGRVLDVGRRRRVVPPAIRRALEWRDGTCRFPGCANRHVDAHHVRHWADGGATRLDNLVLLCRRHHRLVHEEGFRVEPADGKRGKDGATGRFRFLRPDGRAVPEVPPAPPTGPEPVATLLEQHHRMGIRPDPWDPTPEWHGERLDLDFAIRALRPPKAA